MHAVKQKKLAKKNMIRKITTWEKSQLEIHRSLFLRNIPAKSLCCENNPFFLRLCLGVGNFVKAEQAASGGRLDFQSQRGEFWECQRGMASVAEDTASEELCCHQFRLCFLASECGCLGWLECTKFTRKDE